MTSVESVAPTAGAPILVLEKLDKRFGATHALKSVDLTFEEGEIHAIVGENGAGKSTLIKVLTAVHPRTSGEVYWQGKSGPARQPARVDRPRHQRGPPGSRALPAPHGRRQHLPRRRGDARRASSTRGGWCATRRKLLDELGFTLPAGAIALVPDHRPAAARRDRARGAARREIPHLRRADRLPHPPGSGGALQADPPAQGARA